MVGICRLCPLYIPQLLILVTIYDFKVPEGAKRSYDFPPNGFCFFLPNVVLFPIWFLLSFVCIFTARYVFCFAIIMLLPSFRCAFSKRSLFLSALYVCALCFPAGSCFLCFRVMGEWNHVWTWFFFPRVQQQHVSYFVILSYFLLRMFAVVISMPLFSMSCLSLSSA